MNFLRRDFELVPEEPGVPVLLILIFVAMAFSPSRSCVQDVATGNVEAHAAPSEHADE